MDVEDLLRNGQAMYPAPVSKLMGHAKELITVDVYGDNQNIIPEEIPELLSYLDDVMPKKRDGDKQGDDALDAGTNVLKLRFLSIQIKCPMV